MVDLSDLRIAFADPRGAEADRLMKAQLAEIEVRYGSSDPEEPLIVPEGLDDPGGAFVIAWVGGRAVGCGGIRAFGQEPGVGEVKRMYVQPEVRGLRIGEKILRKLEEAAREKGYTALVLETGYLQPDAMRLYERAGYRVIPCYAPYTDGDSTCYRKEIGGQPDA